MARAMLEYTKTVLGKVSFDRTLFCKEVQKAVERLLPYEIEELKIFNSFSCTAEPRIRSMFNLFKSIKKKPNYTKYQNRMVKQKVNLNELGILYRAHFI